MKDSILSIIKYIILGFVLTAVLVGVKIAVEHTSWGHSLEEKAFEILQGQLSPFNPKKDLPIIVVDINDIREYKDGVVVDFKELKKLVSAIADEKPQAIGIDAILLPNEINLEKANEEEIKKYNQQTADYVDFLDFCLSLKEKGIPVFVGVDEATAVNSSEWLGNEKYKSLASTVLIKKEDPSRIPIWFKAKSDSEALYSLSASLAKSSKRVQSPPILSWAIENGEEFPGTKKSLDEGVEHLLALVNYSKLEVIRQRKLSITKPDAIKQESEKFRNRMVLLGQDKNASDKFLVAGHGVVPGVYIHASAAYTFAQEPMYELKFWVRLVLDFVLSAFIIVWVAAKRYQYLGKSQEFDWHKLQSWLGFISLILIGILAILLVRYAGVLWLDFLLVAFFLWIHPKAEKLVMAKLGKTH